MNDKDLALAISTLAGKQEEHTKFLDYYSGDHPLVYNAHKLRDIFKDLNARFTENWCGVVVDSVLDRLVLNGFTVANSVALTDRLRTLFMQTELDLDADDTHLAALVTGEAFIIVWREDDGEIQAFYNDPRQCHVFYEAANPHVARMACKWWQGDDGHRYVTLYYADRLEYYKSRKPTKAEEHTKASHYDLIDGDGNPTDTPTDNPFGRICVFQFRRERRAIRSELASIIEPQDSVNKLVSDMMVAAEFAAFRQRYVISQADIRGKLPAGAGEIWGIPAGDGEGEGTKVGEFSATDLDNYIKAIDQRVNTVAAISRTPKHFFFSQGGDPSGDALVTMEAPINKKAMRYIARFSATWRKVAQFLLELDGVSVAETDIEPNYAAPETIQPMVASQIRQTNVNAGIPLITQLKWEGWAEEEIVEMEKDADRATARQQAGIGAALLNAQEQFSRGGVAVGDGEGVGEGVVPA